MQWIYIMYVYTYTFTDDTVVFMVKHTSYQYMHGQKT